MKFVIKSKNVLNNNELRESAVLIQDGIIFDVFEYDFDFTFDSRISDIFDYGELIIMPSIIDTHVHINEPGRTDWEGFESATKAAAAGGITMLVDMPLNSSPVTTTLDSLNQKINSSENKLFVDVGLYGGMIPGNLKELKFLIHKGVFGLKAFMINSGIDEFPFVNEIDIRKVFKHLEPLSGIKEIPFLFHAEVISDIIKPNNYSGYSFKSFLETRPDVMETKAVELLIKLCREFRFRIHIVHLSSSESIDLIKAAKKEGLPLTTETCPHYLYFSSDEIPDNDTRFKCTPPIRNNINKELLWEAVKDGTIDFIVSDHSPCNPELKCMEEGNFEKAWGGISGLQFGLSVIWTEALKRNISIAKVSELMSKNTAEFIGLGNRKGKIQKGFDADIIIFNPDKKFIVKEENIFHKHKITPYSGKELTGVVETTFLRGEKVFDNGKIVSGPLGKLLLKQVN